MVEMTRGGEDAQHVGRTVIVGVGNPVLTDDGVGVQVARSLRPELRYRTDVEVTELYVGGMALMEALVGFDRAIVVDSMVGGGDPGAIYRLSPDDLAETRNSACVHNTSLSTALSIARLLEMPLPGQIDIWGIEPRDVETFGEELTNVVAEAVPKVVDGILKALAPPPANGEHRENRRLLL